MGNFACIKAEDKIVDELIGNCIEEHLLIEFTFETVLKSLLREEPTEAETPKSLIQAKQSATEPLVPIVVTTK